MGIYKLGNNYYELVLEERNKMRTVENRSYVYEDALYIDLEDVNSTDTENRRGIDGSLIFLERIDTGAMSAADLVDKYVKELIDRFIFRGTPEYNSKQVVPDGLEKEIRDFLEPRILKVYGETAEKVTGDN